MSWSSLGRGFFVAYLMLPATMMTVYAVTGDDTYFGAILIILAPLSMVGFLYGFIFLGLLSIVSPVKNAVGAIMSGIFTAIAYVYANLARLALDSCRARRHRAVA